MLSEVKAKGDLIKEKFGSLFDNLNFTFRFNMGEFLIQITSYDEDWRHQQYEKDHTLGFSEFEWSLDFKTFEEFMVVLKQNNLRIIRLEHLEGDFFTIVIGDF